MPPTSPITIIIITIIVVIISVNVIIVAIAIVIVIVMGSACEWLLCEHESCIATSCPLQKSHLISSHLGVINKRCLRVALTNQVQLDCNLTFMWCLSIFCSKHMPSFFVDWHLHKRYGVARYEK